MRVIDDIFLIWTKSFERFNKFKEKPSTIHLLIKFDFNDIHTKKAFTITPEVTIEKVHGPTSLTSPQIKKHNFLTHEVVLYKTQIKLLGRGYKMEEIVNTIEKKLQHYQKMFVEENYTCFDKQWDTAKKLVPP